MQKPTETSNRGTTIMLDLFLLIILALLNLINPPVNPMIEAMPKAIMTASWGDEMLSDVDTHVITPDGRHLSYVAKDIDGRISLARDDLGLSYSSMKDKILSNYEIVEFHSLDDGEYRVAMRMYQLRDDPIIGVDVKVVLETTRPYQRYLSKTVNLTTNKETIPIAIITVKDNKIIDVDVDVSFTL